MGKPSIHIQHIVKVTIRVNMLEITQSFVHVQCDFVNRTTVHFSLTLLTWMFSSSLSSQITHINKLYMYVVGYLQ